MESQLLRVFVLYVEQRCSESASKVLKVIYPILPYPSLSLILIEKSYLDAPSKLRDRRRR
jgi:hypothetical protein